MTGYCSADELRNICTITTAEVSDAIMLVLITQAAAIINREIGYRIENERVEYIDDERENDRDDSNTIFYVYNCGPGARGFLGDRDNDGDVGTGDIYVYGIGSDGTRTEYTISTLNDDELGKYTLSAAPTTDEVADGMFNSYVVFPIEHDHALIKLANMYLAASMAYDRLEVGQYTRVRTQGMQIWRHTDAGNYFYKKYKETMRDITASKKSSVHKSKTKIPKIPEIGE